MINWSKTVYLISSKNHELIKYLKENLFKDNEFIFTSLINVPDALLEFTQPTNKLVADLLVILMFCYNNSYPVDDTNEEYDLEKLSLLSFSDVCDLLTDESVKEELYLNEPFKEFIERIEAERHEESVLEILKSHRKDLYDLLLNYLENWRLTGHFTLVDYFQMEYGFDTPANECITDLSLDDKISGSMFTANGITAIFFSELAKVLKDKFNCDFTMDVKFIDVESESIYTFADNNYQAKDLVKLN